MGMKIPTGVGKEGGEKVKVNWRKCKVWSVLRRFKMLVKMIQSCASNQGAPMSQENCFHCRWMTLVPAFLLLFGREKSLSASSCLPQYSGLWQNPGKDFVSQSIRKKKKDWYVFWSLILYLLFKRRRLEEVVALATEIIHTQTYGTKLPRDGFRVSEFLLFIISY